MRVTKFWSAEDIHTLREMWLDGFMPDEIAAKLDRSSDAVDHKARSMGLGPNMPARRKPFVLPPTDQCEWLAGEKPDYVRCTNKKWRGAWCEEHWKTTHYGSRRERHDEEEDL
jgi:hypothetical protein